MSNRRCVDRFVVACPCCSSRLAVRYVWSDPDLITENALNLERVSLRWPARALTVRRRAERLTETTAVRAAASRARSRAGRDDHS